MEGGVFFVWIEFFRKGTHTQFYERLDVSGGAEGERLVPVYFTYVILTPTTTPFCGWEHNGH